MFEDDLQVNVGERSTPPAFDLRRVWWFLSERWWIMALCALLAGMGAIIYLVNAPRIYAATAVVKFESEAPQALKIDGMADEDYRSENIRQEKLKEYQQVIQSRVLLARVIDRNGLTTNPDFMPRGQNLPPEKLAGRLLNMLRVALRPGTRLIDVTVEATNPELAAKLANSVVKELIQQDAELRRGSSKAATSFLSEEAERLQKKIDECDAKLQEYKEQALPLEQRQLVVGENLKNLNQQLSASKVERIRLESEYFPVRDMNGDVPMLLSVSRIAGDPAVTALQASIAQQEVEFANVRQMYKEKHPTYIQAESKLTELRQGLSNAVVKATQTMRQSYENALARETSLGKEIEQQEQAVRSFSGSSPYNNLLRDREQYQTLHDAVVKRMGETTMAGNLETSRLQIFQSAEPPRNAIKPRPIMVLGAGLVLGLGFGLIVSLGLMFWDDSLKTLAEAEHFLKQPVLSTIPRVRLFNDGHPPIVVNNELPSAGAQSFRYLRTSLMLNDPDGKCRSFLFTSTMPSEGKTFCTLNFAASLARQGLRTLLVDCDLQRPMMTKLLLGKEPPVAGVSDYLSGETCDIRATEVENLSFCSAGTKLADASELLAQRRLTVFLNSALQQFDRVVIDSAPIFGVSDTLLICHDVSTVCLVVRAGSTSREAALRALQTLAKSGASLAGIILNAVPESRMAMHGNPYYDYGYKTTSSR